MTSGAAPSPDARQTFQAEANDTLWRDTDVTGVYDNRTLRPVEVRLLVSYRDELTGRVLDLGCGAGRLTGYLVEGGADVHGIDISERMLAVARTRYPGARWEQGDLRAVGELPAGAYDVVVLAWNVIDVLDDATRREFLGAVRRVLTPDGLLIFSSHNLAAADTRGDATRVRRDTPKHLVRDLLTLPRRWRNHRRRAPYEVHADDHAILNDLTHDFSAMHYYIGRDAQQRQLEAAGFELLECRDLDGRLVAPGEAAAGSSELHYVARPG